MVWSLQTTAELFAGCQEAVCPEATGKRRAKRPATKAGKKAARPPLREPPPSALHRPRKAPPRASSMRERRDVQSLPHNKFDSSHRRHAPVLILAGDIGGTKTLLQLADCSVKGSVRVLAEAAFASRDH